jgi:hypothetical protein
MAVTQPDYTVSSDMTYWVRYMRLEQRNARFLETIKRYNESWKSDKEFSKIVKKIERGKNLKKKEFAKIHLFL